MLYEGDSISNPNTVALPKKLFQIIFASFILFILIIFSFVIYSFGESAHKDGVIAKLEKKLSVAVEMLCHKDVDEIAFVKTKDENRKTKITINCNPEPKKVRLLCEYQKPVRL